MTIKDYTQKFQPVLSGKYNDLLRVVTFLVKQDEWVSLRGFQPRHAKWWWL